MDSKLSLKMMMVEILSRTSLKTLDTMRCTSKEFDKFTYDPYLLNLYKQRNNIVSGTLMQGVKTEIKKFEPSHKSNSLDLDFLPPKASIVATSEQGIVVFEISKIRNHWLNVYYVCKPATKLVLALPKLKNKYETVKVAIVVLGSNPLHYKIVRWSLHKTKSFSCFNYVVTRKESQSRYETYHCEIFDSMTWEWRQTGMLRMCLSFIQNYRQPITTRGSIYMLLTNNKVLKFDAYSEISTMFSLPVPTLVYPDFTCSQQLIKYEGKLGFVCKPPNGYWEIWVLTADQSWEKIDGFEEKKEAPDGLFGLGMGITKYYNNDSKKIVLTEHHNYKTFTFRSDFEAVDLASRKKSKIANRIRHLFFKTRQ